MSANESTSNAGADADARSQPRGESPSIDEAVDLAGELVSLQIAKVALALRRAGIWVVLAVIAAVGMATLTVVSTWVLVEGLARAGGELFESTPWLGSVIAGLSGFLVIGLLLRFAFSRAEAAIAGRVRRRAERADARLRGGGPA